jgi:predicted ATPase
MEKLTVKNFGPIIDVSINIKNINIFIGNTSTGKSVIAKLINIFNDGSFISEAGTEKFIQLLDDHNINFIDKNLTTIKYEYKDYIWEFSDNQFFTNYPFKGKDNLLEVLFNNDIGEYIKSDNTVPRIMQVTIALMALDEKDLINRLSLNNCNINVKSVVEILNKLSLYKENLKSNRHFDWTESEKDFRELYKALKDHIFNNNSVYIPAERIYLSMVSESIFNIIKGNIKLANCIVKFAKLFEDARKIVKKLDIEFLDVKYEYDEENKILLKNNAKILLEKSSSGFQSVIPLLVILEYLSKSKNRNEYCLVIEEPELNLYPSMQKYLVSFIIEKMKRKGKIIFTSHSPYILSSLNNLVMPDSISKEYPNRKEQLTNIISENLWIEFDKIGSYYFESGYAKDINDYEFKSIDTSKIDGVSDLISEEFEWLLKIKYN